MLRFTARDGNVLTAYTHRSPTFDAATGPIVFIMHGVSRDAVGYLDNWIDEVDAAGALAIAPEFPEALYPDSEDYSLGVGTQGTPDGSTYNAALWRSPGDFSLSEVEHLFEAVREEVGSERCRYLIYGHSAGAQFVHRLLTFRTDVRVQRAIAANAGWYTLPSVGSGTDPNRSIPYGLQGAPPVDMAALFAHDFLILLGEADVVRDAELRTTARADAQGLNRFERGQFYFAVAQEEAIAAGVPLRWTLDTVPGVGHTNAGMTPSAAAHLFAP